MKLKIMIKSTLFVTGLLLALLALNACLFSDTAPLPDNQFTLVADPSSGYYPLPGTLTATELTGGQYSFTLEGHTYTQGSNIIPVTFSILPCEAEVVWERPGYETQMATCTIALDNEGPDPGQLVINGINNRWTIQAGQRHIITYPNALDREGGPATLVSVHIQASLKGSEEDTVFCPTYAGPDVYHVYDRNGMLIKNAFAFHSLWTGPIDVAFNVHPSWKSTRTYFQGDLVNWNGNAYECKKDDAIGVKPGVTAGWKKTWTDRGPVGYGSNLPFSPPGYGESGYPGAGVHCDIDGWPDHSMMSQTTTITSTWQDQDGATTIDVQEIPTTPYVTCN